LAGGWGGLPSAIRYNDGINDIGFYMFNLSDSLTARMRRLEIVDSNLNEKFSRSGGAGGQNVNKVSSRVQLSYLHPHYGPINVSCQKERDQEKNRIAARVRLCERIEQAMEAEALARSEKAHRQRQKNRKPSKRAKAIKKDQKIRNSKKKADRRVSFDD